MSGNGSSKINGEGIARDVIVIGASMGGVAALRWLCAELPADFPGLIGVVLHRSSFGTRVVGLLLTGGGADGVRGLVCVKVHRGLSVIQDPTEAINPSMPVRALRDDHVDMVTSLRDMPVLLHDLASGRSIVCS